MEEACHSSVNLIGEQWDECVNRFERNYWQINTKMIRTLGKLSVIDNPRTSFIKDDKNDLISIRASTTTDSEITSQQKLKSDGNWKPKNYQEPIFRPGDCTLAEA